MTTQRGRPEPGRDFHLDRIYARIDELSSRVRSLENKVYAGVGGLGVIAVLNLITNIAQQVGTK